MKRNTLLIIGSTLVLLVLVGGFLAYDHMYAPHRNIAKEEAMAQMSATELLGKIKEGNGSSGDWADTVLEVNGTVSAIENATTLILEHAVQVDLDIGLTTDAIKSGNTIVLKGRCVGYDDLLEMVKMDQVMILSNN